MEVTKRTITKEEKAQAKELRAVRRYQREQEAEEKAYRGLVKREVKILKFMLKSGVGYHHHGRVDMLDAKVKEQMTALQVPNPRWNVYEPYLWNYTADKRSYNSRCLLGNLWDATEEFKTIYDVPLDGTYRLVVTDSGARGLGSYNYMKAVKVGEKFEAQEVDPGAFRSFGF